MGYDDWKSREPSDQHGWQVSDAVHGSGHLVTCTDCHAKAWEGTHSTPLAAFCDPCWRWRQARGWEFDSRTKAQLEAAECAA